MASPPPSARPPGKEGQKARKGGRSQGLARGPGHRPGLGKGERRKGAEGKAGQTVPGEQGARAGGGSARAAAAGTPKRQLGNHREAEPPSQRRRARRQVPGRPGSRRAREGASYAGAAAPPPPIPRSLSSPHPAGLGAPPGPGRRRLRSRYLRGPTDILRPRLGSQRRCHVPPVAPAAPRAPAGPEQSVRDGHRQPLPGPRRHSRSTTVASLPTASTSAHTRRCSVREKKIQNWKRLSPPSKGERRGPERPELWLPEGRCHRTRSRDAARRREPTPPASAGH